MLRWVTTESANNREIERIAKKAKRSAYENTYLCRLVQKSFQTLSPSINLPSIMRLTVRKI